MTENDKSAPAQASVGPLAPDPASAWPFPANQDLGAGEELDVITELEARDLFQEARARRAYRHGAVVAALVVLTVLLAALICVISTFVGQVNVAPKVIVEKVLETSVPKSSASAVGSTTLALPSGATSAAASASGTGAPVSGNGPPKWTASVSVDTTSIANSVVAISSILVVAVVVLAIALVKATFSMESPHGKKDDGKPKKPDDGITLPGAEIVKAVGDVLSSTVKAVVGDGKK